MDEKMSDNREYKWKQMPRFFDEMRVSCSNSKTERKSINCRIVFVVILRAPVYRVVFTKKKFFYLTIPN